MVTPEYCKMIAAGVIDEIQAQIEYEKLIEATDNEQDKQILINIKKQEYEHMKNLQELLENCFL